MFCLSALFATTRQSVGLNSSRVYEYLRILFFFFYLTFFGVANYFHYYELVLSIYPFSLETEGRRIALGSRLFERCENGGYTAERSGRER